MHNSVSQTTEFDCTKSWIVTNVLLDKHHKPWQSHYLTIHNTTEEHAQIIT